jgi:uncharacterized protein YegL
MNEPESLHTVIVLLLDRSGSMEAIRGATIAAVNDFFDTQRRVPGRASVTLVLFDDQFELRHDGLDLEVVPPLTDETFVPRGSTALLDAWGRAMGETQARLAALPPADQPDLVVFVVMTDGEENASREWSAEQVFAVVERRRADGWRFVFLGANQDAVAVAGRCGVDRSHTLTYDASDMGTRTVVTVVSASVARVRRGEADSGTWFTDAERAEQDELLRQSKKKLH